MELNTCTQILLRFFCKNMSSKKFTRDFNFKWRVFTSTCWPNKRKYKSFCVWILDIKAALTDWTETPDSLREAWRSCRRLCPWKAEGSSMSSHVADRDGWPNVCLFFSENLDCGSDKDRWAVTWADLKCVPCHPSTGHVARGSLGIGWCPWVEGWKERHGSAALKNVFLGAFSF